jgi:hypothetical protein
MIGCFVRAGGDVIVTATGAAVMGHPAASVVWLVNPPRGDREIEHRRHLRSIDM